MSTHDCVYYNTPWAYDMQGMIRSRPTESATFDTAFTAGIFSATVVGPSIFGSCLGSNRTVKKTGSYAVGRSSAQEGQSSHDSDGMCCKASGLAPRSNTGRKSTSPSPYCEPQE